MLHNTDFSLVPVPIPRVFWLYCVNWSLQRSELLLELTLFMRSTVFEYRDISIRTMKIRDFGPGSLLDRSMHSYSLLKVCSDCFQHGINVFFLFSVKNAVSTCPIYSVWTPSVLNMLSERPLLLSFPLKLHELNKSIVLEKVNRKCHSVKGQVLPWMQWIGECSVCKFSVWKLMCLSTVAVSGTLQSAVWHHSFFSLRCAILNPLGNFHWSDWNCQGLGVLHKAGNVLQLQRQNQTVWSWQRE